MWTSKKVGVPANHVKVHQVARIKCADRELCVDLIEGRRISLLFANADEAALWVKALSCLVPLQARINAPSVVIPPEKEREEFTLSHDMFNGRSLREHVGIGNYVLLCSAKGHPAANGHKVVFARSDSSFCTLRYVPRKLVPLLLRSQEEIAVLKRLKHPNIVQYHECLLDQEHGGTYLTFEFLARGTLIDGSKLEGVDPIPEHSARELIRDVVNGLEYLHRLRIAHADVRPDNLLRSVDGRVKLNPIGCITHDFTEIKNLTTLVKTRLGDASPAFLAPELCWLCDAPPAHPKSYAMDVWAVGVVLYFMLYGRVPFGGRDDQEIQTAICTRKLRFPRHPETSKKVRSLLKGVLGEKDPKTRIGLSELKRHPWFAEGESETSNASSSASNQLIRLTVPQEEIYYAVQRAKITGSPEKS
ncbi:Protein kinase [Gracilaria domingensis]|nr:Protein kinase [Gracilaria domingensis]